MKLLLLSNSTNAGEEYLGWPKSLIAEFQKDAAVTQCLFIPYAGVTVTWDAYTEKVKGIFEQLGTGLESIHTFPDPVEAVRKAECIVVGGGNTFRLVQLLYEHGLMEVIREKVLLGTPFMGWSAGSNIAGPSMRTTNDMPIIQPKSFDTLNLVPFQINPHYLDANPEGHGGETREQRIMEFLEINREIIVVGLREACGLWVENSVVRLKGNKPMRIFQFNKESFEVLPGSDLSFLMKYDGSKLP